MRRRAVSIVTVLVLPILLAALPVLARDPWPGSANLCAAPEDVGSGCVSPYAYEAYLYLASLAQLPNDFAGGDLWKYSSARSGFPEIDNDPRELGGVVGMSIDRAWLRSTGRPDVVIAVLDSGIRWDDEDLREKAYVSRGEVPPPAASTNPLDPWDANFDGALSPADYAGEVADLNANGGLDAGDLIRHFSDGVDDDANGFVDDISGWNFLDDTNDAFDEVDYGHGTGEASDSTAEADNGGGFPGVCPSCRFLPLRVGQSFIAHSEDYAQAVLYAVDAGASVVQEALGTVDMVRLANDAHRYAWERGVPLIASAADEAAYHHNFPSGGDYTINLNSIRGPEDIFQQAPRSRLMVNGCTNYGGNVWASVSSTSCSSEATGRGAGIAGLLESHARNLVALGRLAPHPDAGEFASGNVLSAAEVRQLFRSGAEDIALGPAQPVASPVPTVRYPSQPGWDPYTGWGRLNADLMLSRLDANAIPPEAAIVSPTWWATADSLHGGVLEVAAELRAHRVAGPWTATLEFGCGPSPLVFHPFSQHAGVARAGAPARDVTAALSLRDVAVACAIAPRPPVGPDDFAVQLRLSVRDAAGNVGEDRRSIQVTADPTLMAGWPRLLDGSGEASPRVADLDGDGRAEIVVSTASGRVHAFRADGTERRGFPVETDPISGLHVGQRAFARDLDAREYRDSLAHGGLAIADLDGDDRLEIVAPSLNGRLYAWGADGTHLPGFPVSVDPAFSRPENRDEHNTVIAGFQAAPSLADLDADGDLEIVVASLDRHVYAWHHDGAAVAGFPVHLADPAMVVVDPITHRVTPRPGVDAYRGAQIVSTTAIGDLDGDGRWEIVVGANEHYREPLAVSAVSATSLAVGAAGLDAGSGRLYALRADGLFLPGFPAKVPDLAAEVLPYVGEGVPGSPALADLDADGRDEIVIFAAAGPITVLRGDGAPFYGMGPDGRPLAPSMEAVGPLSGAIDVPVLPGLGSAAVGRFGAGPAIVYPGVGLGRALDVLLPELQVVSQDYTAVIDGRTGAPLPAWPRPIEDFQFITTPTIVNVDADPLPEIVQGSGGYLLHAWNLDGSEVVGFPKATNHWLIATVAVGDLDGDGFREVVEASREGWLWVWRTTAIEALSFDEWRGPHHDDRNTGRWTGSVAGVGGLP